MIKSMTGYGRCEAESDGLFITVELKSVNHRYFELSARIPRSYGFLEERLKSLLNGCVSRGKIDVYVSVDTSGAESTGVESATEVNINHSLATGYVNAIRELISKYGLRDDLSANTLARYSDIFTVRKSAVDEEKIWAAVETAAKSALERFIEMREREGEKLKEDILFRAAEILKMVETIEQRAPLLAAEYREKLESRMRELIDDVKVDEQRLITETAIMADRMAVSEETVRLKSHIAQLNSILDTDIPVGRKLDFLIQEFNREANTIGSKIQNLEMTRLVVDIKSEIEKIREQIQNIE